VAQTLRAIAIETSIAEVRSGLVSPNVPAIIVAFVLGSFGMGVPGCAGSPGSAGSPGPAPLEPEPADRSAEDRSLASETAFAALEERLGQTPWRLRFELEAEGAVVASLAGSLSIAEEIELEAAGRFAGADHDLRLWTGGDHLRAGPREAPTLDLPRPPELVPALVIGMTRMGLLHNVAMLVGGRPPDRADGGVREWVRTSEHVERDASGETALGFAIVVAGERTGRATLWLDAQGRPVRREQTVEFPEGQMRVVERYEWLEPLPPAAG
jgi:hypothetical protein